MINISVISSILCIYFCNFNLFIFESIPPNKQINIKVVVVVVVETFGSFDSLILTIAP